MYVWLSIAIFLFLPIGWLFGRVMDLNWRCKKMRQLFKKDYRLLKFKFKGSKTFFGRIVDVSTGVITVGSNQWILAGDRMYLESNEKVGLNITKLDKDPSYDDGCPVIFVDGDNITPLEFQGDGTNVRPEELGATYSGYLLNQMMKALSFVKNIKSILMIIVFCCAICAVFAYLAHTDMAAMNVKLDNIQGVLNATNATISQQTVISQGEVHG